MNIILIQQLSDLFRQAGQAHHRAFIHTGGDDPEWPLWYADYLHPKLKGYLAKPLTKSELVCWLVKTEKERAAGDWPTQYALGLINQYGREAA